VIYDEPARLDVAQTYESGPLFDIGGSYLIYDNFGVGLSYSRTSGDGVATVTGQIPDPDVTDRPRAASASADGLGHTENAVHVQVFYRFAATPKLDISVGLGPTFYSMTQDLIDTVDVAEPGPTITPRPAEVSESPVGFNIGADATYMINERFGAGVLLRIATGSADMALPSGGSVEVDAGGFQFAVGLRVRF
jgi:Outer membrane protein beta-barrel domain